VTEKTSTYSVIRLRYLGREFEVPVYPWDALNVDDYALIASAFTKEFIYNKWSEKCTMDHNTWKRGKIRLEPLRFLLSLSSDLGFRTAIRNFNRQVDRLKYGGDSWLFPLYSDTPDWRKAISQLGGFVHNIFTFYKKTGYVVVYRHKTLKSTSLVRPYFVKAYDATLEKMWLEECMRFIIKRMKATGRFPSLRDISDHFGVSRRLLAESGFTYAFLMRVFRAYKAEGGIRSLRRLRLDRPYKPLTEKDIERWVKNIVREVSSDGRTA